MLRLFYTIINEKRITSRSRYSPVLVMVSRNLNQRSHPKCRLKWRHQRRPKRSLQLRQHWSTLDRWWKTNLISLEHPTPFRSRFDEGLRSPRRAVRRENSSRQPSKLSHHKLQNLKSKSDLVCNLWCPVKFFRNTPFFPLSYRTRTAEPVVAFEFEETSCKSGGYVLIRILLFSINSCCSILYL